MPRKRGVPIKEEREITSADVRQIMGPIGQSGTLIYEGYYNLKDELEYVSELIDARAIDTYNRMRRSDGQVALALRALENPILNAEWSLHPPGDPAQDDQPTPEELEQTKKINDWIFGEEFQLTETLRQILSMFWAGFSVFEKLYSVNEDGLVVVKKLAPRLQNTIKEWKIDEEGNIEQIRQVIFGGKNPVDVWIPGHKLVVFTYQKEGDDYRGISALRAAYKHWFHKDFFYRVDAMKNERWGLGIPVIKEEDTISPSGRKSSLIEAVENMRAHEQGYLYLPRGYTVEMLDGGSGKMIDLMPSIQHHDAQILKTIMAQFLELGMTETGARSLGETLKNQYLMSLQQVANYVAETLNKHVIKPIVKLNFGDMARTPYLCAKGIQAEDMGIISQAVNALGNSGLISKGPKIEGYFRDILGIPMEDEEYLEEQAELERKRTEAMSQLTNPSNPDEENQEEEKEDQEDLKDEADDSKEEQGKIEAKERPHVHGPNCKHGIQNAEAPPFTPLGMESATIIEFWRPLRPHEEHLSLRSIAGKLDDAREQIVRDTRDARDRLVNELMPQIAEAYQKASPILAAKIDYSDELADTLEKEVENVLWDVYTYGYQQVNTELARQTKRIKNVFPFADTATEKFKKARELIATHAFTTREISLDKVVDLARSIALTAARTGIFNPSDARKELEQFSENRVRDAGGYVVNDSHSMGRDEAMRERKDEIAYVEYSAILDQNTCDNCYELDQKNERYEVGSPEFEQYTPPLFSCEGKGRCRCIWVVVHKDETTAEV